MRVLLVEDDTTTAKSIELMLKSEGFVVDTTNLGEDGLEIGKLYDYDIVILDLMLPDMDGYEVLRRLRAARVTTPVLILSGLAEPDNKIKGLGYGADDYLTKPFEPAELVARVEVGLRVVQLQRSLAARVAELEEALAHVNRLERLLPICARCKRIQSNEQWHDLENFLASSAGVRFSHGACPGCAQLWEDDGFKA